MNPLEGRDVGIGCARMSTVNTAKNTCLLLSMYTVPGDTFCRSEGCSYCLYALINLCCSGLTLTADTETWRNSALGPLPLQQTPFATLCILKHVKTSNICRYSSECFGTGRHGKAASVVTSTSVSAGRACLLLRGKSLFPLPHLFTVDTTSCLHSQIPNPKLSSSMSLERASIGASPSRTHCGEQRRKP